jgi:DNA-binding transcriptional MerR regulator
MEYTINKLAKMAGVSTRTLRFYDEMGLLTPARVSANGYRIYGQKEIDLLQQVLFYRELGVPLEDIKKIVCSKDFDSEAALMKHLAELKNRRDQLDALILNLEKTIKSAKGEITMKDDEKFEGFKQKLIEDNEKQYGAEIRAKYGEAAVNGSNIKIKGMTQAQYAAVEKLSAELSETLKAAFEQEDPSSTLAQKACAQHKEWLSCFWPSYSKEAHIGLGQMYVSDPRFTAYYDKIAPGCAVFLRDAILVYCK